MDDYTLHKMKRFFQVLGICLAIGALVVAAVFWFYTHGADRPASAAAEEEKIPERTNFVVLGVDEEGTRTDVIIVGTFDSSTGAIDLVSVPRDTYVEMPEDRQEILRAEGKWVPQNGAMKINAVHHYAGKEHGTAFIVAQLEDLFGVEIDYYAKVNLEAFRYIVDALGGVTFDVPQRMYYTDPEQKLYIDLQPGLQTLTGAQAEQLVRYRKPDIYNPQSAGYAQGDLDRVRMQQAFLKALVSQILSGKKLLSTTGALVTTVFKYVDTNFNISDVPRYIGYLDDFSTDNISGMTLPADTKTINGQSYVVVREPDAGDLIASVFGGEVVEESSMGKEIMVLNGGHTKGKANEVRKALEEAGFTVSLIGDYSGKLEEPTRIYVRRRGEGTDLRTFFNASEILIDPQTDCDIKIVVGTGE